MRVRRPSGLIKLLILVLLLAQMPAGTQATGAIPFDPSPNHIIMIMIDGFRPDYVTMYAPPNIQRLVAEGAWVAEARSVFPAMTTPNQTSFVTGALPKNTGIPNNSRYDRTLDRFVGPLRDNRSPTIGEIMGQNGWRTASVNHFMMENRGAQRYVRGDMKSLIHLLETDRPGLVVYYNANVDTVGHRSGPFSAETRRAVLDADAEVGLLLDALDRLGLTDQTTLVVASDHGMSPTGGTPIQPSLTDLALSGWRIAGDQSQIRPDTELVYIASGGIHLYWREGKRTPEREAQLLSVLNTFEGADIYTAEDIEREGADPERLGDIAIVPRPGRSLTTERVGGGKHGTPNEAHNMVLFWGQGIRAGSIAPEASITDIVPTLLTLARIDIPDSVDGRPLTSIIERSTWKGRLTAAGDYQVKDVAASGGSLFDTPAMIADGSTFSLWETSLGDAPAYVALDYGTPRLVSAIEIVAAQSRTPMGPKDVTVEISADGRQFSPIHSTTLDAIRSGQSDTIALPKAVSTRYLRLTIDSSWGGNTVQVAEFRTWAHRASAP